MEGLLFSLLLSSFSPVLPLDSISDADMMCLTKNIYFESRNQDIIGQIAVAHVTINRVIDSRYPDTICAVVKQGYVEGRRDCQFSWYCDGKPDRMVEEDERIIASAIAEAVIQGRFVDITDGATHYHANHITPYWSRSLTRIAAIEDHTFYRWETANN